MSVTTLGLLTGEEEDGEEKEDVAGRGGEGKEKGVKRGRMKKEMDDEEVYK